MRKTFITLLVLPFLLLTSCDDIGKSISEEEGLEIANSISNATIDVKNIKYEWHQETTTNSGSTKTTFSEERRVTINQNGEIYNSLKDSDGKTNNTGYTYLVNSKKYGGVYYSKTYGDDTKNVVLKNETPNIWNVVLERMSVETYNPMRYADLYRKNPIAILMSAVGNELDEDDFEDIEYSYFSKGEGCLYMKANYSSADGSLVNSAFVRYENNLLKEARGESSKSNGEKKKTSIKLDYPSSKISITLPKGWEKDISSATD